MAGRVVVRKEGDILALGWVSGTRYTGRSLEAVVTLPELHRLEAAGAAEITMSGFDEQHLDVEVSDGSPTGGATGTSKIVYEGEVAHQSLRISGVGGVKRR